MKSVAAAASGEATWSRVDRSWNDCWTCPHIRSEGGRRATRDEDRTDAAGADRARLGRVIRTPSLTGRSIPNAGLARSPLPRWTMDAAREEVMMNRMQLIRIATQL